jgi:hypothetical protein
MSKVIYKTDLDNVDWTAMKTTLRQDAFDNGRSAESVAEYKYDSAPLPPKFGGESKFKVPQTWGI